MRPRTREHQRRLGAGTGLEPKPCTPSGSGQRAPRHGNGREMLLQGMLKPWHALMPVMVQLQSTTLLTVVARAQSRLRRPQQTLCQSPCLSIPGPNTMHQWQQGLHTPHSCQPAGVATATAKWPLRTPQQALAGMGTADLAPPHSPTGTPFCFRIPA